MVQTFSGKWGGDSIGSSSPSTSAIEVALKNLCGYYNFEADKKYPNIAFFSL